MKHILSVILLLTIVSCSSFKDYSNQQYLLKDNSKQSFIIINNQPFLKVELNGTEGLFLLDTGAGTSIVSDSMFFNKIKNNISLKETKLYNAYKEKLTAYKLMINDVTSEIFDSKNIQMNYFEIKNNLGIYTCDTMRINSNGIIGLNHFINSQKTIVLDFEQNNIQIIDANFERDNYKEVTAEFKFLNKKIILPLTLNNKLIDFLFDTGNNSGFIVDQNSFKDEIPSEEYEMYMGGFNGITIQQTKKFNNVEISKFPFSIEKQKVTAISSATTNTLGMAFLGKFNWIIDFKNEKVYCKQNEKFENKNDAEEQVLANQSIIIENKLTVGFKIKNNSKYNVGDEILSVNNSKVTLDNICKFRDLLNNTVDWSTLNLEVKSSVKQ